MKKQQLYTGLVVLILGWVGVASMLTMELPIPEHVLALLQKRYSDSQIKALVLLGPSIYVVIATVIGTLLYKKVNLTVPIIESFFNKRIVSNYQSCLKSGALGGLLAGVLIGIVTLIFQPFFPKEFVELSKTLQPSLFVRFLYGGLTEEILLRFGFMTLVVWIMTKITKQLNTTTYWVGIIVASIIFAFGHFPVVYGLVENPPLQLLMYIVLGNSAGGLIFGWLYYKKGLESAFMAHMVTHFCLVFGEKLM